MIFDGFFGIDWSGDKSKFQKGIKVAYLDKKNINPKIIAPPNKNRYWNRSSLIEYLKNLNSNKSCLIECFLKYSVGKISTITLFLLFFKL